MKNRVRVSFTVRHQHLESSSAVSNGMLLSQKKHEHHHRPVTWTFQIREKQKKLMSFQWVWTTIGGHDDTCFLVGTGSICTAKNIFVFMGHISSIYYCNSVIMCSCIISLLIITKTDNSVSCILCHINICVGSVLVNIPPVYQIVYHVNKKAIFVLPSMFHKGPQECLFLF